MGLAQIGREVGRKRGAWPWALESLEGRQPRRGAGASCSFDAVTGEGEAAQVHAVGRGTWRGQRERCSLGQIEHVIASLQEEERGGAGTCSSGCVRGGGTGSRIWGMEDRRR